MTRAMHRLGAVGDVIGLGARTLTDLNHRYGLEVGEIPPGAKQRKFGRRDLWAMGLLADLVELDLAHNTAVRIANQAHKILNDAYGEVSEDELQEDLRLDRPLLVVHPGAHPNCWVSPRRAGDVVGELVHHQGAPTQLIVDLEALWSRARLLDDRLRGKHEESDDAD